MLRKTAYWMKLDARPFPSPWRRRPKPAFPERSVSGETTFSNAKTSPTLLRQAAKKALLCPNFPEPDRWKRRSASQSIKLRPSEPFLDTAMAKTAITKMNIKTTLQRTTPDSSCNQSLLWKQFFLSTVLVVDENPNVTPSHLGSLSRRITYICSDDLCNYTLTIKPTMKYIFSLPVWRPSIFSFSQVRRRPKWRRYRLQPRPYPQWRKTMNCRLLSYHAVMSKS